MNRVAVIRTRRLEEAVEFFTALGLTFVREQHGAGPVHYATEANGQVFELYPCRRQDHEGLQFLAPVVPLHP